MNKPKTFEETIMEEMTQEGAEATLELLWNGDAEAFIALAENSPHPGITLVALAKKAQCTPSDGSEEPSEQELVLLASNFHLSRRMIDVACHVAMNPKIDELFQHMAGLVLESKLKQQAQSEAELIRRVTSAKAKKDLPN